MKIISVEMSYFCSGDNRMRRTSSAPHGNMSRSDNVTHPQGNPEIWVQLGEEGRSTNLTILEIVQELKNEMARLH